MQKSMLRCAIYLFLLVLLSMTGCHKFKGDQEVPAYIQIDSIIVSQASASAFGLTPTSKIVDAWITIDGRSLGCYQLPIKSIPVLAEGEHKVLIQAGILANNLSLRRGIYPFYSGVELTVNFVEDSIINVTRKEDGTMRTAVAIREYNKYPLGNENFERGKHGFDTISSYKSVQLQMIQCKDVKYQGEKLIPTPQRFYEDHVGLIHLTKSDSCCCITTKEACTKGTETALPYSQPIFIELDYLTNNTFEVGIVSTISNRPYLHPVVIVGNQKDLDVREKWSKIYVDISSAVGTQYFNADDFKILIRAYLEEGNEEAYIYLDNIRIVYSSQTI